MLGRHFVADISGASRNLVTERSARLFLDGVCKIMGASEISRHVKVFDDRKDSEGAYTAVALIEESHVSIHTWPEHAKASIDVYTCKPEVMDVELKEFISDFFGVGRLQSMAFYRDLAGSRDDMALYSLTKLFVDRTTKKGVRVVIADTAEKGISLFLNGERQSSECDEAVYHQSMVWAGAAICKRPIRNVLVAGCGEGAVFRFLQDLYIRRIDWVDWDSDVVDLCLEHLPYSPKFGTYLWPKNLTFWQADVLEFLGRPHIPKYDLILWDLPELKGDGGGCDHLYDSDVFAKLKDAMSVDGVLVVEAGSPHSWCSHPIRDIKKRLESVFRGGTVFPYAATEIPWCWVVATVQPFDEVIVNLEGCPISPYLDQLVYRARRQMPPELFERLA